MEGIRYCLLTERNFKIQSSFALLTFLSGIFFHLKNYELLVILLCTAMVLCLELINTAIEKLADVVCPATHPAIKKIKDISAGAVFLAATTSCITGLVIFLPKIDHLLKNILK